MHPSQFPFSIRRATGTDASALTTFGAQTFRETFGADNTPADLTAYLQGAFSETIQQRELTDPACITLLAEIEERQTLVGYAQLWIGQAPENVTDNGTSWVELRRLYVDTAWHGRGVALVLIAEALRQTRDRGAAMMWLGVWERNPRAIRFYEKCGFQYAGSHEFVLGSDVQTDLIMIRDTIPLVRRSADDRTSAGDTPI